MAVVDPGVDHGLLRAALFEILINFFERANKFFSPFIFFFFSKFKILLYKSDTKLFDCFC